MGRLSRKRGVGELRKAAGGSHGGPRSFLAGLPNRLLPAGWSALLQEPKYAAYMELFDPLCGPAGPSRPLLVGDTGDQKASRGRVDMATVVHMT